MSNVLETLLGMQTIGGLASQLLLPNLFSQVEGGGGSPGTAGSVGQLIPAAIQTAGVYAQAAVLKNFDVALERLAALCYLVALVAAIASVAVYGSYQRALYFLVGPSLFFFMVKKTDTVDGAQLKMGNNVVRGSVQDQLDFLKTYTNDADYNGNAEVSFFYLAWDKLVSSVVQDVVDVLVDSENQEDLIYKGRERYLSWVLHSTPSEPPFLKLVGMGYLGGCAKIFHRFEGLLEEKLDPSKRQVRGNLTRAGERSLKKYEELKGKKNLVLDPEVVAFLGGAKIGGEYLKAPVSCEDVWSFIAQFTREYATGQLNIQRFLSDAPQDPEIPWDKVQEEVRKALAGKTNPATGQSNAAAEDILAAYIIKNSLTKASHQMMVASTFEKVPFNAERKTTIYEDVAGTELFGGYVRIAYFAAAIPYIQGLLLYLLSISFPFFAVFLVMPGRATTFILWMSLWAWVKSWDVGFAMVHSARKILWQFVTHSTNSYGETIDFSKPETVFSLIGDNDPLAHENTYFQIVAILTTSIPLLTAHFCLGATSMFNAFRLSIDETANEFGIASARAMRRKLGSEAESFVDQKRAYVGLKAMQEVMKNGAKDLEGNEIKDKGDNSIALAAQAAYDTAVIHWDMSEEGINARARLSALTTRTSNFYVGHGEKYLRAYVTMQDLTSFKGVGAGEGSALGSERKPVQEPTPAAHAPDKPDRVQDRE